MTKHAFGDVVLYQRGKDSVNALVVQSHTQADGEHMMVAYLDPAMASPLLSGTNVEKAIATAFVSPLTERKTFGWKELPEPTLPVGGEPSAECGEDTGRLSPEDAAKAADAVFGPVEPGAPESPHAIDIGGQPGEPQPDGGTYLSGVAGTAPAPKEAEQETSNDPIDDSSK